MLELPVLNKTLPLLSLLLLAGCSSTPSQPISAQTYFRGLVRIADNQLQYRSCDQANWRSEIQGVASIRERLLDRLLSAPLGVGIYLEAWGDAQGRLTELQMLGGDIATCRFNLDGIELRAGGLNPVWYADLRDGALVVHDSTRLRSWQLSSPSFKQSANRWSWSAEGTRLTVKTEACRDALGVEYALSAQFTAGQTQLNGCARYGDLQRNLLKRHYYSRDSTLLRQFALELQVDDRFDLSLIDRKGETERYQGSWQVLKSGELLLRFSDERLRGSGKSLRFKSEEGALRLMNQHPVFGKDTRLYPGVEPLLSTLRLSRTIP